MRSKGWRRWIVLQDPDRRNAFVAKNLDDARTDKFLGSNTGKDVAVGTASTQRSDVSADHAVPTPPFWGTRVLDAIPLKEVFELLDLDELYRLQWGGRGSGPEYEKVVREEFEPVRHRLEADAIAKGWLKPQAVYGYFPRSRRATTSSSTIPTQYVLNGATREISRFKFPRMDGRERLCIADYFRSVESGEVDVASLQVVTVGTAPDAKFLQLQTANEYTEAYFTHGIAVETAEAVAEWMHRHIRAELRIPPGRGKRYSWGYGACPDLEDHAEVFKLLPAESALGMELTSAFQLMPEQSTAAFIVHHPQAKYYAVRAEGGKAVV